jgi:hypothetical protein
MDKRQYVSKNGVSRDLLEIVARFGLAELRPYIQSARNKGEVYSILMQAIEWLDNGKFQAVRDLNQDVRVGTLPGFQSFEKAWQQLVKCADLPLNRLKNKYQLVLDSVTFVEADIMRRLIRGEFDVENVKIIYGLETAEKTNDEVFLTPKEPEKIAEVVAEVLGATENKSQAAVDESIERAANDVAGKQTNTETTDVITTKKKRARKTKNKETE